MSNCIEADVISPKHSSCVTIMNATIIPNTTNISIVVTSGAAAPVTMTGVATVSGNLCKLYINQISFTGTGAALAVDSTNLSMLSTPSSIIYQPIMINDDSTKDIGSIYLNLDKSITFYSANANGLFTSSASCIIYPCVLYYFTS